MRAILTVMMILTADAAWATEAQQKAINAVAMRLTTAYQCQPLTGDRSAYEAAKAAAPKALEGAGVTTPTAAEMIAATEAQLQDSSKLTPAICKSLLEMMK